MLDRLRSIVTDLDLKQSEFLQSLQFLSLYLKIGMHLTWNQETIDLSGNKSLNV